MDLEIASVLRAHYADAILFLAIQSIASASYAQEPWRKAPFINISHPLRYRPGQIDWMKKQTATIILLDPLNRCLLFLRDDKPTIPYPNSWDLLGGLIEIGETPEEAICREMLEEIELTLTNPALFKVYDLPDRVEHLFWQRTDLDINETNLHEGQKLAWFSEEQIRSMKSDGLAFGFRDIVIDFYTTRPFNGGI